MTDLLPLLHYLQVLFDTQLVVVSCFPNLLVDHVAVFNEHSFKSSLSTSIVLHIS